MSLTRVLSAAAAGLLLIAVAGCSADSSGVSTGGGPSEVQVLPAEPLPEGLVAETLPDLSSEPFPGSPEVADQATSRSIVRGASIEIVVKSAQDSAAEAADVAAQHGGSVSSQSLSNDIGSNSTAQLLIRVPSDKLADALDDLGSLGDVRFEQRSADDVTETHVDLQARAEALQASIDRLTALMEGATSTSDLIEAETALTERQQQLDGLRAQLEALEGQIDQADIWVMLTESSALPGGGPQSFWDAIMTGFASIGAFFAAVYIGAGVALPWLVLVAAIILVIVVAVRVRKRRARSRRTAAQAPDPKAADSVVPEETS